MREGVSLNADAITSGNGGKIIIWADGYTDYGGSLSARGGRLGGDGGFAEVSGHRMLGFHGSVDTRAPLGKIGTLLLDPDSVTINGSASTNLGYFDGGNPNTYTPASSPTIINDSDLEGLLNATDVTITTGSFSGDISVLTNLTWTTNLLTLTTTSGNVNLSSVLNGGSLSVTANSGSIFIDTPTITTTGSQRYFSDINLLQTATLTTTDASTIIFLGGNVTSAGDNLLLTGTGGGVNFSIDSNSLNLGGGQIIVTGTTGDTLSLRTGNSTQDWDLTGADAGTALSNDIAFSNIANLHGYNNNDYFTIEVGSSLSGELNGGSDGTDTLDLSPSTNNFNLILSALGSEHGYAGSESGLFAISDFENINAVIGTGEASSKMFASDIPNVWVITGANSGTLNGASSLTFSAIPNLVGGTDNDSFSFVTGASIPGTIDGGTSGTNTIDVSNFSTPETLSIATGSSGSDTLGLYTSFANISDYIGTTSGVNVLQGLASGSNLVNITGADSGTSFASGSINFTHFGSYVGGSDDDTIDIFPGASLSGSLDAGAGGFLNYIVNENDNVTFTITGPGSGTMTSVAGGFSNANGLFLGGAGDNYFILAGGTVGKVLSGTSTGTTTLIADNVDNTWNITGGDIGTVTGVGLQFQLVSNIKGGTGNDFFSIDLGGSISGSIDGGSAGTDTLYYNVTAVGAQILTINGTGSSKGLAGTTDLLSSFDNIDSIIGWGGGSPNIITGPNIATTWTLTNPSEGVITSAGQSLSFTNFGILNAGSANDTFVFNDGVDFGGTDTIDGGGGTNTLNYSAYTTPISLIMTSESAGTTENDSASVITTFTNINDGVGSSNSSLQFPNKSNTVTINSDGSGFFNDPFNFSGYRQFISVSGTDRVLLPSNTVYLGSNQVSINGVTYNFSNITITAPASSITTTDNSIKPLVIVATTTNNSSNQQTLAILFLENLNISLSLTDSSILGIIQDEINLDLSQKESLTASTYCSRVQ